MGRNKVCVSPNSDFHACVAQVRSRVVWLRSEYAKRVCHSTSHPFHASQIETETLPPLVVLLILRESGASPSNGLAPIRVTVVAPQDTPDGPL